MTLRTLVLATAVCTVTLGGLGAGTASAGEITGNGRLKSDTKEFTANSICAYSGQNDGYHVPELAEDEVDALQRVQSYGQAVRAGIPLPDFLKPGSSCNGHSGLLAGGGGEH